MKQFGVSVALTFLGKRTNRRRTYLVSNYPPRIAFLLSLLWCTAADGQNLTVGNAAGSTPPSLQGGAPAGAYAISDVDHINLYNGNLNLVLPSITWQDAGKRNSLSRCPSSGDGTRCTNLRSTGSGRT